MNSQGLLTPNEVADRLTIPRQTLLSWAKEGRIPSIRLSRKTLRFLEKDVDQFILQ